MTFLITCCIITTGYFDFWVITMNNVQEFIYNVLPQIKNRGEWHCFNCPSCVTRFGEGRPDSKKRGGLKFDTFEKLSESENQSAIDAKIEQLNKRFAQQEHLYK